MRSPSGPASSFAATHPPSIPAWSGAARSSGNWPTAEQNAADAQTRSPEVTASHYFRTKPAFDGLAAIVLAVVALPVMAVIGLAVLLCDGRPVFYRQSRVGKHGRSFLIWKFRTMGREAERQTGPVWSCDADLRVTRLGRWLRLSHLDELPQIINVLSGEMSLIGPRPERPEFVRQLAIELPDYMQRLQVRPGITGIAQLTLGYDRCVADVGRKVELDLQYIRTATLAADLMLLFRTVPCVLDQLWQQYHASRHTAAAQVVVKEPATVPLAQVQPRVAPPKPLAGAALPRVVPRRRTA